ncbi:unnamed protein product [Cylicostephanus goldi]|uniref:Uncharacterized protein n=1 Tax=Cylicostephanus goldi TaxID=71465 RepID=A0A3P6RNZ2_CYLGO|nr:unnamed protein product [Cylicostephanus goldi]
MCGEIKIALMLICLIGVEACIGPHCPMPWLAPGPAMTFTFVQPPINVQTSAWATVYKQQPHVWLKPVRQPTWVWGPKLVPVFTGPRAPVCEFSIIMHQSSPTVY